MAENSWYEEITSLSPYVYNFYGGTIKTMELSVKTVHGYVLKITQLSAHAQNHVGIERWR